MFFIINGVQSWEITNVNESQRNWLQTLSENIPGACLTETKPRGIGFGLYTFLSFRMLMVEIGYSDEVSKADLFYNARYVGAKYE